MSGEQILDPCCGSRMFYFDKKNPNVLFCDIRSGIDKLMDSGKKRLVIEPDMVADVTNLPFENASFSLVIFDPPHLIGSKAGIMKEYYGSLSSVPAAREFLEKGFSECWRVLKPGGTLIFKWFEHKLRLKEIIKLAPCEPICGNKKVGNEKTHWLVFCKPEPKMVPPILADAAQPVLRDPAIDRAYERGRLEGAMAERRFRETLAGAAQ